MNKRFNKFIKKCPLTLVLIASVVIMTVYSFFASAFSKYKFSIKWDHPLLVSVLNNELDGGGTVTAGADGSDVATGTDDTGVDFLLSVGSAKNVDMTLAEPVAGQEIPTQFVAVTPVAEDSPYYNDPGRKALTTAYPFVTVDNSYYDDAVFIGDSRIEGLATYGGLDGATFYCQRGLTVYNMMSEAVATTDAGAVTTIPDALSQKQFKKIYIMIGINELGDKTTPEYAAKYRENLDTIMSLQPNAVVYIMAIMNVTTEYSNNTTVFNNVNINDKNVSVAGFANGIDIFYIDSNPALSNEDGGLIPEYTWDGIHLQAEYYQLWIDFLNQHGLPESALQ